MQLIARTLRYLANRFLADPDRSNQNIARANAAEASATLRKRRHEQDDVDAYLRARCQTNHGTGETDTRRRESAPEHTP